MNMNEVRAIAKEGGARHLGRVLFHPPILRLRALERPRLQPEEDVPLTVLCAPSGYGKSVMLAQWGARWDATHTAVSWLLLGDQRVTEREFWDLLAHSLGLDLSRTSDEEQVRHAISLYLQSLTEKLVVVVDNYEYATTPALDQNIARLLDNSFHLDLVVSARRITTLAGPLVTSGYTTRILAAGDLAFTSAEARDLARLHGNQPAGRIAEFSESVGGWPLSVRAACASTQDPNEQLELIVAQLVRRTAAAGGSRILHATAMCPRASTHVLESIAPGRGACSTEDSPPAGGTELGTPVQDVCEELECLGLLIKVSAHGDARYICHPGIARTMQRRAKESFTASEYARLRKNYATDIEDREPATALDVLLKLGDVEAAEQVARRHPVTLLNTLDQTREALNSVDPSSTSGHVAMDALRLFVDQDDPIISEEVRWQRMQVRRATMNRLLLDGDADSLLYVACSLMASEYMLGHTDEAYRMAQDLERRLDALGDSNDAGQRAPHALIRTLIGFGGAAIGDFEFAERNYLSGLRLAAKDDNLPLRMRAQRGITLVKYCTGDLVAARESFEALQGLASSWRDRSGGAQREISDVHVTEILLGNTPFEGWTCGKEPEQVPEHLMKAKIRAVSYPLLIMAEAEATRRLHGDLHALRLLRHRVRRWPMKDSPPTAFGWKLRRYTADLMMVSGDVASAQLELATLPDGGFGKSISTARLHLFEGHPEHALDELGAIATGTQTPLLQLERQLLAAIALWQVGLDKRALRTITDATRDMRDISGYGVLAWVPYAQLLELAAFAETNGVDGLHEHVLALPENLRCPQYERLSRAELRTLTELAGGTSLEQVASELFISKNTLKSHLRSIYRKLHASNRHEALVRAQSLGIIARPQAGGTRSAEHRE